MGSNKYYSSSLIGENGHISQLVSLLLLMSLMRGKMPGDLSRDEEYVLSI